MRRVSLLSLGLLLVSLTPVLSIGCGKTEETPPPSAEELRDQFRTQSEIGNDDLELFVAGLLCDYEAACRSTPPVCERDCAAQKRRNPQKLVPELLLRGSRPVNTKAALDCWDRVDELSCGLEGVTAALFACQKELKLDVIGPPAEAGEECVTDDDCVAEHYCELIGCAPNICRRYRREGDTCSTQVLESHCAPGLTCFQGACGVPGKQGEPCSTSSNCSGGLYCVDRVCKEEGRPEGESCEETSECQSGLKCRWIDDEKLCALPALSGESCSEDEQCASSLYCVQTSNGRTCLAPQSDGGPCVFDYHCEGDLFCRSEGLASSSCRPRLGLGEACHGSSICQEGLGCFGAHCQPPPPEPDKCLAQTCKTTSECVRAECIGGICQIPPPAPAEATLSLCD